MHRYGEFLFSRESEGNSRIRENLLWQRDLADSPVLGFCFTTNEAELQADEVTSSVSYGLLSNFNDFV